MEICWVQNLLKELGYTPTAPAKLYMDNQSAMSVAKNPEHHGRMKHLDLWFYWLRNCVEEQLISPQYIPTADMAADILTKALPRQTWGSGPSQAWHERVLEVLRISTYTVSSWSTSSLLKSPDFYNLNYIYCIFMVNFITIEIS